MPFGSEDSLHKAIWTNPDDSCIATYTVTVFGDLRDKYEEDIPEIIEWFKTICSKVSVRDAMILAHINNAEPTTWIYEGGES